jgi:hypothetical protein
MCLVENKSTAKAALGNRTTLSENLRTTAFRIDSFNNNLRKNRKTEIARNWPFSPFWKVQLSRVIRMNGRIGLIEEWLVNCLDNGRWHGEKRAKKRPARRLMQQPAPVSTEIIVSYEMITSVILVMSE